jgi:murein DD-endopeptidase MepM/ murein hydrolase activator NlpD
MVSRLPGTWGAQEDQYMGETAQEEKLGSLEQVDFTVEEGIINKLLSRLSTSQADIPLQHEVAEDLLRQMEEERSIIAHTPTLCPAGGLLTSLYGWRDSPFTGDREFHKGVDIASRSSSPVYAPADGIVSSYSRCGALGNVLEIDHGYGMVTRYGHLCKPGVKVGQHVKKGDKIAYMGDSGWSTGSHLHYEIIIHGINVNPQRYMLK